tara:strand:+ start:1369 stop:1509 length:141 start_codon:yes stop_codon:yes gene_type:complete
LPYDVDPLRYRPQVPHDLETTVEALVEALVAAQASSPEEALPPVEV